MRRSSTALLAVFLIAAGPEAPRFDLDAAFRSVLEPEQARALSQEKELSVLARAFTPEQRQAVSARLREAEGTSDPSALREIHRGYLALRDAEGAGRVGDVLIGRFPASPTGYVMKGQAAELRGDFAGAAEQAREALNHDPKDPAAHALLRLSEGRANTMSSPSPTSVMDGGVSASAAFLTAPRSGASPEALDLMRQAVAAREAGDMARVQALAQAAMNSDPKSAAVQRFHDLAQEDRRNVLRTQVGLYAALERRKDETRARREVAAELEARRRAARRHQVPPIAPLSAGAILLTLGVMAWNHGLKDEAQRRADETKRVAAAGLIILGCAGISYGASAMIFSTAEAAPVLEPAVAGAGGVRVVGPVVRWGRAGLDAAKAGIITLATMAGIRTASDGRLQAQQGSLPEKDVRASGEGSNDPLPPPHPGEGPVFLPFPIAKQEKKSCSLRPGEDVLDRFIDGTRLAPGFLKKHEGPGKGHTISEHVSQRPEDLLRQIQSGKNDASSYPDLATAEGITKKAIDGDMARVAAWFASPIRSRHNSRYTGSISRSIGYTISAENPDVLMPKYDALAVLQKTDDCGILILTAYPN